MSPPLSSSTSTTPTCPAVAARIRGVKPGEKIKFALVKSKKNLSHKVKLTLYVPVVKNTIKGLLNVSKCIFMYLFCPDVQCWPPVQ